MARPDTMICVYFLLPSRGGEMIASGEHSFPSKPRRGCADEERTHEGLKAHLRELVDPKIAEPVQSGAPRPPPRAARDFAMSGQYPAISCNSSLFAANGEPGTSPSPAAARLAAVPKPGSTRSCPTSDRGGASLVKRRPLASAALLSGRAPYRESFDFLDASMFDKRS